MAGESQGEGIGYTPLYRDTNLPPELLGMYQVGTIMREPTFCDATYKFGGLAARHRYLLLSLTSACIDEVSLHPEWGLHIWEPNTIFKVISKVESHGYSQVTLLEVPLELLEPLSSPELCESEIWYASKAEAQFEEALSLEPLPEHSTELWLSRLVFPVGIDDDGKYYELEQGDS